MWLDPTTFVSFKTCCSHIGIKVRCHHMICAFSLFRKASVKLTVEFCLQISCQELLWSTQYAGKGVAHKIWCGWDSAPTISYSNSLKTRECFVRPALQQPDHHSSIVLRFSKLSALQELLSADLKMYFFLQETFSVCVSLKKKMLPHYSRKESHMHNYCAE